MPERSQRFVGRRRTWAILGLIFSVLLAVALLPTVIVNSPLRQSLLDRASEQVHGTLSCGRISTGWFSPLKIQDVELQDADGRTVATLADATVSATLVQLLTQPSNPGRITVRGLEVECVIRPGGSNLEDVLAPLLTPSSEPSQLAKLSITVEEPTVRFVDGSGTLLGEWRAGSCDVHWDADSKSLDWEVKTSVASGGSQTGILACEGLCRLGDKSSGKITIKSEHLPLAFASVCALRLDEPMVVGGVVHGDVEVAWDGPSGLARITRLNATDVEVAAPRYLQADRARASQLSAQGELYFDQEAVRARDFLLTSDWARVEVSGDMNMEAARRAMSGSRWRDLAEAIRGEAVGELDLAQLARILPATLSIRADTRIERGGVEFAVSNLPASQGGRDLAIRLDTRAIEAVAGGQRVAWRDPLTIRAAAHIDARGWSVEQLNCDCEFFNLQGTGDLQDGELMLNANLGQFQQRLEQFVDLQGWDMQGRVTGSSRWNQSPAGYEVAGDLQIANFEIKSPRHARWREPQVEINSRVELVQVEDGWAPQDWRASVIAGQERLSIAPSGDAHYELQVAGELERMLTLMALVATPPETQISGRLRGAARLTAAADHLDVTHADWRIDAFAVRTTDRSLDIRDPRLSGEASGRWAWESRQWQTDNLTLRSTAISLASRDLRITTSPSLAPQGKISVRGDLRRISQWAPGIFDQNQFRGDAVGTVDIIRQADRKQFGWSLEIKNAEFHRDAPRQPGIIPATSGPETPLWSEPTVQTSGEVALTPNGFQLHGVQAITDWLSLAVNGWIDPARSGCPVDLKGVVTYDWQTASQRLPQLANPNITLYGKQSQEFLIKGPLADNTSPGAAAVSADLQVEGTLGWDRGNAFGFLLGPAEIQGRLHNQQAVTAPIRLAVGSGEITLHPRIDLRDEPALLSLESGDGVRRVQLTPEMCRGWLKYIAPLLANTTRAQGELSLELDRTVIPLDQLQNMSANGVLTIHEGQIGPSALTNELLGPVQQILAIADPEAASDFARQRWLQIPQQQVAFHVDRGRVHHRNLLLRIRDVEIRTSGSVGLDESLELVAEIPVQDRWITRSRYLASLQGKVIPLRIRGTFQKPNLDESALRQLGRDSVRGAAERLLQDQLERGLRKIFEP